MANYLVFFFVVSLIAPSVFAERISAYAKMRLASPVLDIGDVDGDWSLVDDGRMIQGGARIGSAWHFSSLWTLSVEQRADYIVHFSEETAQFYSALENNQIEPGIYPLSLNVKAVKANGLALSKSWLLGHASRLELSVNLYEGLRVQSGRLTGQGSVSEQGAVRYDYQIDYGYDENRLLDSPRNSVTGWGHGLDIHYKARFNRWSFDLAFNDLLYRYYWRAPRDKGCLSRPLKPDCSVQSLDREWRQSIPHTHEGQLQYHLSRDLDKPVPSLLYDWQYWGRFESHSFGVKQGSFSVQYEFTKKILGFAYQSDWLAVKWQFDEVELSRARYWQLNANLSWPII
ncbi:hypothetical protein HF888_08475 [Bermanella marisrubri]|uniref:Uncharacterized protein n=1 Tax=Bermanella marisrubri TaxID=207949 RepID=Q1MXT8_9GAMM|nr:hypothetical protein [Bermanella marisrubri]EAT10799.1 hypothetical protein RED65_08709 [Oceanobacter sp. RED65] [Bermanella marisrubri]QIZ84261.1 hypothetical protein HF888_08475 [Bermanella marisrubri]